MQSFLLARLTTPQATHTSVMGAVAPAFDLSRLKVVTVFRRFCHQVHELRLYLILKADSGPCRSLSPDGGQVG